MDIKLTEAAVKDRNNLSEDEWKEIKSKVTEVTENLSHENLKLISNPLLKHPIWQLTVNEEKTDHRVYLDVRNGKTVIIAIWDFKFTHQGDKHWLKLEKRI